MAAVADRVDLIVINRFGRAESLGRGLGACFMAAMEAGVPVLTAVRAPYDDAWRDFHGGLGEDLPADVSAVVNWSRGATRKTPVTPVLQEQAFVA